MREKQERKLLRRKSTYKALVWGGGVDGERELNELKPVLFRAQHASRLHDTFLTDLETYPSQGTNRAHHTVCT